jgi:AcrR family transcriptional regulator
VRQLSPHLTTKKCRRVAEWAEANNVELAYTPTSSSWLTKESLLYAISLEGHHGVLTAIKNADCTDVSARKRLAATVTAYVAWHAHNNALARVVQYELRSLSPEHFAIIADTRRSISKVFAQIIESGAAAGDFHPIDIDAATLAITSLGVDVSRWFPSHTYSDPDALAERYVELALRMVGATS